MKSKAFTLSHSDAGIAYIIGHPMSEDSYFLHFRFLALYQFVNLLLRFGYWVETSVIFVHLIKPTRFFAPVTCSRHHQLRSGIEQVYHIRFFLKRHDVIHGKRIHLTTGIVTHRRCALSLIELKLQLFFFGNAYAIHLSYCRLCRPERHYIIKLPAHRRNKTRIISLVGTKKCVGKALLIYLIINNVARHKSVQLKHNLSCSPIDSTSRSGIIACLAYIYIGSRAILVIDFHHLKTGSGCKRVVIVFKNTVGHHSV